MLKHKTTGKILNKFEVCGPFCELTSRDTKKQKNEL